MNTKTLDGEITNGKITNGEITGGEKRVNATDYCKTDVATTSQEFAHSYILFRGFRLQEIAIPL